MYVHSHNHGYNFITTRNQIFSSLSTKNNKCLRLSIYTRSAEDYSTLPFDMYNVVYSVVYVTKVYPDCGCAHYLKCSAIHNSCTISTEGYTSLTIGHNESSVVYNGSLYSEMLEIWYINETWRPRKAYVDVLCLDFLLRTQWNKDMYARQTWLESNHRCPTDV